MYTIRLDNNNIDCANTNRLELWNIYFRRMNGKHLLREFLHSVMYCTPILYISLFSYLVYKLRTCKFFLKRLSKIIT